MSNYKIHLDSVLPSPDTIITTSRQMTQRERILEGKRTLTNMILMNFFKYDRVSISHNYDRYQFHFDGEAYTIYTRNQRNTIIDKGKTTDEFKAALMEFPIDVLLRISKLLNKNHLTVHCKRQQELKWQFLNAKKQSGATLEDFEMKSWCGLKATLETRYSS